MPEFLLRCPAMSSTYLKPEHIWLDNKVIFISIIYSDCLAAVCQRSAVLLWPQLWSPTPPIWESWPWVTTSWRIQEWSCFVIFYRVQTADWTLWGQFTESVTVVLIFEFTFIHYSCTYTHILIYPSYKSPLVHIFVFFNLDLVLRLLFLKITVENVQLVVKVNECLI